MTSLYYNLLDQVFPFTEATEKAFRFFHVLEIITEKFSTFNIPLNPQRYQNPTAGIFIIIVIFIINIRKYYLQFALAQNRVGVSVR